MKMRFSWREEHLPRCLLNTLVLVVCAGLIFTYLLIGGLDTSPIIRCSCDTLVQTGEREGRYLPELARETMSNEGGSVQDSMATEAPNLPFDFLLQQEMKGSRCHEVPGLFSIHHSNSIWQHQMLSYGVSMWLFSAHLDRRPKQGAVVRILAVSDSPSPVLPYCQFYPSNGSAPLATRAVSIDLLHWQSPLPGMLHSFLITCRSDAIRAAVVSVLPLPCVPATNALKIHNQESYSSKHHKPPPRKKNLALCHKFVFNTFKDNSVRIAEWLETARAWGIDHVTFYVMAAHANVTAVLQHYRKQGLVTVLPWSNPGHYTNVPAMQRMFYDTQRYALFSLENIPYTDCLYRHLSSHRYVAIFDVDEFIIPNSGYDTLTEVIDDAKLDWYGSKRQKCQTMSSEETFLTSSEEIIPKTSLRQSVEEVDRILANNPSPECALPVSYLGQCSYFFDDLGDEDLQKSSQIDLHMLSHATRSVKFTLPRVFSKGIHDTLTAVGMHGHFALYNLHGKVEPDRDIYHLYPPTQGYLAHYRSKCQGEDQTECEEKFRPFVVRDERLQLHREQVEKGVMEAMKHLA